MSRASPSPTTATAASSPLGQARAVRPVCDAVQHAHQRAVIHRDLKALEHLGRGSRRAPVPKIIDFGVWPRPPQRLRPGARSSPSGPVIGTPEYIGPEQAAGHEDDIDTRTDVYALGAALRTHVRRPALRVGRARKAGHAADPPHHPRGGPASAGDARRQPRRPGHAGPPIMARVAPGPAEGTARRPRLDHDDGAGEGPRLALRDG
ncbi:MAG: hypothetical protein IPI48_17080 [bacterium]|nr:hypothetical protein [bacterium]